MRGMIQGWFEPSAFTPHGFCLLWEPGLIWLHTVSDILIALAYFSIPLAIIAFLRRRQDLEYRWVAWLFAGFILACGATHVMSIVTLWQPYYWLQGGVKLGTALISLATAALLWPLLPKLLALPSPAALRDANMALAGKITERNALVAALERREAELLELTATLEAGVAKRTQSLADANRRFETALAASGVTVFTQDENLAYTYLSKGELGLTPEEFLGRTDAQVIPEPPLTALVAFKQGVLESGLSARGEFQVFNQWFELVAERLPEGGGIICGAIDITRRKQDEDRIRFLLQEVNHRVGNLLAVAQAMLVQSAKSTDSVEELMERYGLRLRSLARSQQLLLRAADETATLEEVVAAQLAHFGQDADSPIRIAGPMIPLEPAGVLHIGMAVHELATNAAKYGALSVAEGRVDLTWEIEEDHARLVWREAGGPSVPAPPRRGFGRDVIEWAVAEAVQGQVRLEFAPGGVEWELRFPLQA